MRTREIIKKLLVNSPFKYSERFDAMVRLTLLKSWIERHQPHQYFSSREDLYAHVAKKIIGDTPVTYLEFGVYRGDSLIDWAELNTSPESEFIGFDSFEGLPEAWINVSKTFPKGSYSTGGNLPVFEDPRIRLVKGWFQESIPAFTGGFNTDKQVVVHCDADLYTSTLYVLCKLDTLIKPGAIIIFDDFSSMLHDFRAWDDYTRSFHREYELIGAAGRTYYEHVALKITR